MRPDFRFVWLLPLSACLIAATAPGEPEDYVRQGNAAFEREEFEAAIKLYTQAADRITNPGMVAFNQAAALFRSEDYRGAEAHYRRCLEDATGARRATMLYNLGNCLLMQSKGIDPKLLRNAVDCYGMAIREQQLTDPLHDDACHNLEIAKVLWVKARQAQPRKEKERPDNPDDDPKKPPEQKTPDDKNPGTDPSVTPRPDPSSRPQPVNPNDPRQPIPVDNHTQAPGQGNLPPVPDKDEFTRMLPEDAERHMVRAAERIMRERRDHQQRMAPGVSREIKDW